MPLLSRVSTNMTKRSVDIYSESAKHYSPCSVVNLTSTYLNWIVIGEMDALRMMVYLGLSGFKDRHQGMQRA